MSYAEFVKRVITVGAIFVLGLAAWELRQILLLAFLAVVIAISLSLPVGRLTRMGMRRTMAIAITVSGVVGAITLFFLAVMPAIVVQTGELVAELPDAYDDVRGRYQDFYEDQNSDVQRFMPELNDEQINTFLDNAGNLLSPFIADAGGIVAGFFGNLLVIIVIALFLLLDPKDYAQGFILLIPPDYRQRALEVMLELRGSLTAWLTALSFSISVTILLVWIGLGGIWGLPNALGLAVIAGISTIIPNIGSVIPIIPISIITLADDPARLPFILATYLAIQLTESNIITPSFVKYQMNIPAALVFVFQLIAAALFGVLGILLAVPLLATIITLIRELYVYDMLGQRGVKVILEDSSIGSLQLLVEEPDGDRQQLSVMTQTFSALQTLEMDMEEPPEELIERAERKATPPSENIPGEGDT